ncbi:MAG: dTMP kinase [Alphaproteobacteria bacterium]|nr:dTMP kinase [Alphaproteobacteria bacterium]
MLGKFITLEGGEGTGKSTQVKLLAEYLQSKGCNVVTTKEPGGTEVGLEIRRLLVCGDKDKMDATAEALLYFADRHIHLEQKIWPAMRGGKVVISDRFADSTVAYQCYGYGQRVKREVIDELYKIAVGNFKPDLTIVLDIDPKVGLQRSFAKADGMVEKELRFEVRELEFHNNLRRGFLEIAKQEPERCVVLDADKTVEDLHKDIVATVAQRLGL